MEKNTELMTEVREAIRANPDLHDQGGWSSDGSRLPGECGTTGCIAGWTAAVRGLTVAEVGYAHSDGVFGWAADELGLDEEEAKTLFFCMDRASSLAFLDQLIEEGRAQQ